MIVRREIRSVVLNVRIRPSLKALLEKCAERDGQSLSGWIEDRLTEVAAKPKPKG
jgi:predicted HicB family RNase H-like nuclease